MKYLATIIVLQIADIALTIFAIQNGYQEGNPLYSSIGGIIPLLIVLSLTKATGLYVLFRFINLHHKPILSTLALSLSAIIVLWNLMALTTSCGTVDEPLQDTVYLSDLYVNNYQLLEPYGTSVYDDNDQPLTAMTWTTADWDLEAWDNGDLHNTDNSSRITINQTGVYFIAAEIYVDSVTNPSQWVNVRVVKNNTTDILYNVFPATNGDWDVIHQISGLANLASGDYIDVRVYPVQTSTLYDGNGYSMFQVQRVY